MKTFLIFFLCLATYSISAQKLENCSACSTKKYSNADINENELYEIELLRNEIFARHQFSFENESLTEYYSRFDWYKPNTKNVSLNALEKHNVSLFKQKEALIKKNRKDLIAALEKLKKDLKEQSNESIKLVFNDVIDQNDTDFYNAIVTALNNALGTINLKNMNWHKGKAQYVISIDDGFSFSTKAITVHGQIVTILITDPSGHSDLMNNKDAFEYPSTYESESENTIGAKFEFKNGKLVLIKPIIAG